MHNIDDVLDCLYHDPITRHNNVHLKDFELEEVGRLFSWVIKPTVENYKAWKEFKKLREYLSNIKYGDRVRVSAGQFLTDKKEFVGYLYHCSDTGLNIRIDTQYWNLRDIIVHRWTGNGFNTSKSILLPNNG